VKTCGFPLAKNNENAYRMEPIAHRFEASQQKHRDEALMKQSDRKGFDMNFPSRLAGLCFAMSVVAFGQTIHPVGNIFKPQAAPAESVYHLSLLVLIPLSAVFIRSLGSGWGHFWEVVTAPRVLASLRLSFGALSLTRGEERSEIPVALSDRYRSEVEDFADAILQQRAPRLGPAESLRNMGVLDRLLAASGA